MKRSRSSFPPVPLGNATAITASLLLCLLLGGCKALIPENWKVPPDHPRAPIVNHSTLDADDLFAYTRHLMALNHEELSQEVAARTERVSAAHLALDRAKLALALALPNQGQRDTTKALLAISEVPRDDPSLDAASVALVNYAEALLAWQARQEESLQAVLQDRPAPTPPAAASAGPPPELAGLQALAQKLRADLKRSEANVDTLTTRVREEKARADSLQQKLDALGNLEKSLAERKAGRPDAAR